MRRRLLALAALVLLGAAGWTAYELHRPYRGYSGNVLVEIDPGAQALSVAELLVSRGVLAHRAPFLAIYLVGRTRLRVKAGEYMFDHPLRPIDVYRKLVYGDIYLHTVVVPEGSDRFEMARILHERLGLDAAAFLHITEQSAPIRDLDPQAPSLEGYLFPDSYRFARGVSPATVVAAMLARFRHVLATKFQQDLPSGSTNLHEVMTLASLVEKETPDPSERPIIAGVFTRRLAKGMLLQCDPTVIYAARLDQRPLGPITQSDLESASPYNTYRKLGLPPGPIGNPGEASIRAALHPAAGKELYFVSNTHHGHLFATTLAEHQRNVARYRKEMAALRHSAPEEPKSSIRPAKRGANRAATQTRNSVKPPEQETDRP